MVKAYRDNEIKTAVVEWKHLLEVVNQCGKVRIQYGRRWKKWPRKDVSIRGKRALSRWSRPTVNQISSTETLLKDRKTV